jgi:hypothetical protein
MLHVPLQSEAESFCLREARMLQCLHFKPAIGTNQRSFFLTGAFHSIHKRGLDRLLVLFPRTQPPATS